MDDPLTEEEKKTLLGLARTTLERSLRGQELPPLDLAAMTPHLREPGASFITLTIHGDLRGCVGALEAYQPLAQDVREHALAAALEDPRFPPVTAEELADIEIEVSRLTQPERLEYQDPADLLKRLRPGIDGVILQDGWQRATYLPQVWDKIPDTAEFLDNLCAKMGAAPNTWQRKPLDVRTYQVQEFHE